MKHAPYTFEKKDGKWTSKISGKFLFEMYSVYGYPLELSIEEIKSWSQEKKHNAMLNSWVEFSKENHINLDEIRASNLVMKDDFIATLDKM